MDDDQSDFDPVSVSQPFVLACGKSFVIDVCAVAAAQISDKIAIFGFYDVSLTARDVSIWVVKGHIKVWTVSFGWIGTA